MTRHSINLNEYVDTFPEEGETINTYHCKSGANNDRLYITRKSGGVVVGFCHHCGESGYLNEEGQTTLNTLSKKPKSKKDTFQKFNIPPLSEWGKNTRWETPVFTKLPEKFRRWWLENGLNVADVKSFGIKHLDGNLTAIPLCSEPEKLTGLAIRPLREKLPKWILAGDKYQAPFTTCGKPVNKIVITEDIVSAFRVSRSAFAMPLMGTHFGDRHIELLLKENRPILVWLDNDNMEVIHKAKDIFARLSGLVETSIFLENQEPKHFIHNKDLEDVIHG